MPPRHLPMTVGVVVLTQPEFPDVRAESGEAVNVFPLVSTIEPADEFRAWLLGQIR